MLHVALLYTRKANSDVDEQDIMGFVAGLVAPYKKVRAVEFIDAIPKTASGKLLRRELVALDRSGRE